ncbi:MAG TPA: CAP domain-containing protein [Devosiaceae bacterium]|jgi:uncharacterized protein YkwD
MLAITRRGFLVAAAATSLSACASVPTLQVAGPEDHSPEALTQASILAEINAVRAANGHRPWTYNPALEAAARTQAHLMASRDTLSHNLGKTLRQRVTDAGYIGAVGENVAGGYKTLPATLDGWLASPGHRSTLLSDKFVEFGLAFARVPATKKSRMGIYWSLIAGGSFAAWLV